MKPDDETARLIEIKIMIKQVSLIHTIPINVLYVFICILVHSRCITQKDSWAVKVYHY